MMHSEWRQAILAAMQWLLIGMGYPLLLHVEVAYAMAQRRQAAATRAEYAG